MKISLCTRNLKRALGLYEARRINCRQATPLPKEPSLRKEEAEFTPFNPAIRLSRFRGSSINRQNAGKRFSPRTERACGIPKHSRLAKPWLFPKVLTFAHRRVPRWCLPIIRTHCANLALGRLLQNTPSNKLKKDRRHDRQPVPPGDICSALRANLV